MFALRQRRLAEVPWLSLWESCRRRRRRGYLALPLGELSAELTERVSLVDPLRPRCARTPPPKGEARVRAILHWCAQIRDCILRRRGKPLPYITTKRAAARRFATLLLIRRFAPPSPHGEGWGYPNSSSTAWMLGSVHVGCTPYFSQSAATPSPERTNTVSMPAFLPQAMSV